MKNVILIMMMLLSLPAYSANVSKTTMDKTALSLAKTEGLRLGIVKNFFEWEGKLKWMEQGEIISESYEDNAKQDIGLQVGYQDMNPYDLGFNLLFTYNKFNHETNTLRLESNLVYGVNQIFSLAAGINILRFLDKDLKDIDSKIGFQGGISAHLQNYDLKLMYVQSNNKYELKGTGFSESDIWLKGLELSMGLTF